MVYMLNDAVTPWNVMTTGFGEQFHTLSKFTDRFVAP